jgi:hypothetical protein
MERMGIDRTAEMALEMAWDGVDMVYMSFDIDSIDCGFVPGTGWPEPGGFLPREALALASKVAAEGICGMELVEVSPPYDTSDITALMGTRVIVDVLGSMVSNGTLGKHRAHIDKPVSRPGRDGGPSMKLVDVRLTTEWQVGTASPSFGSRELSYLPFPGEMITERTNMGLVYVSLDAKEVHDIRHLLAERGLD